jgi:hypothetical protein
VAIIDLAASTTLIAGDRAPSESWLVAFVHGSSSAVELGSGRGEDSGGNDVIWSTMPAVELAVVAGRDKIAWRTRERHELDALADIIALRWAELPEPV